MISSKISGDASARVIGVSVKPGETVLTVMLKGASSRAPGARERRKRTLCAVIVAHRRRPGHDECRGGIDDAAELAFFHSRHHCLNGEERALDVGGEQTVEESLVDLFDRRHHAADAGVVDENVQLAELGLCCRDGGLHLSDDTVVSLQAKRRDAVALQCSLRLIEIVLINIGNGHLGPARAKYPRV